MSILAEQIFVSLLTKSNMGPEDDAKTALHCADIFYEAERSHTQKKHEEAQEDKTRAYHEQVIGIIKQSHDVGQSLADNASVPLETLVSCLVHTGTPRKSATAILNDMANQGIICIGHDYVYLPVHP